MMDLEEKTFWQLANKINGAEPGQPIDLTQEERMIINWALGITIGVRLERKRRESLGE